MSSGTPLHVLSLAVENFQRIKVAEIHPDGSLIVLKGPNGAGKSSILDGLVATLGGKRGIAAVPLREGATEGSTRVELGPEGGPVKLIAHRRYDEHGPGDLRLTVPDEGPMTAGQTVLDTITGDLSFDPEAFRLKAPRARAEQLLSVVGLDFSELDGKRQRVFDRRTEVGRAQRRAQTLADDAAPEDRSASFDPQPPDDLTPLEQDVEAQTEALADAKATTAQVGPANDQLVVAHQVLERTQDLLTAARVEVERLATQQETDEQTVKERIAVDVAVRRCAAALDFAELESDLRRAKLSLETAKGINLERGRVQGLEDTLIRLTADRDEKNARVAQLTEEIEAFDAEKIDALGAATFPVPGLAVNEDNEVMLDGFPFDQASESDQLRVSVAMAMALNPELRVAIIRRGSGLDPEQVARIQELVAEVGGQVFIEMVYTSEEQGSIVEVADGEAHS